MALNAAISVADGNVAAASVANGASTFVTPGNTVTFSVTTPGTLTRWTLRFTPCGDPSSISVADQLGGYVFDSTVSTSTTIVMPQRPCSFLVVSEASDGNNTVTATALVFNTNLLANKCRNVVTSLQAYGGTGTATLTQTTPSSGWATQDGVTNVVGDVVFIQGGTTNLTNAKDAGPWVVQSLGSASASWVLVRPAWFAQGAICPLGLVIDIDGEGTLWAGTQWKSFATVGSAVIGTNDLTFYVGRVTQTAVLAAGTIAVTNVGVKSLSKSQFIASMNTNGGTLTGTVGYGVLPNVSALTAGYIGTSSLTFKAIATAQAVQSSDTSTINVTVINW